VWIILFSCNISSKFISFKPISIVSNSVNRVLWENDCSFTFYSAMKERGVGFELVFKFYLEASSFKLLAYWSSLKLVSFSVKLSLMFISSLSLSLFWMYSARLIPIICSICRNIMLPGSCPNRLIFGTLLSLKWLRIKVSFQRFWNK